MAPADDAMPLEVERLPDRDALSRARLRACGRVRTAFDAAEPDPVSGHLSDRRHRGHKEEA